MPNRRNSFGSAHQPPPRASAILAAVLTALVLTAVVGTERARAGDTGLASYCTPTGDYCQGIFKRANGTIYTDLRTFSFRGTVRICVTHTSRVCRSGRLLSADGSLFVVRKRWQDVYPNQGAGRYVVSWESADGTRIGRRLAFQVG